MEIEKSLLLQRQMIRILFTFFLVLFWTHLSANDANRFSIIVSETNTMQGDFHQTVVDLQGDIIQQVDGNFYFKKPNMFKWNYKKPFKNQIISDGEILYLYDPELKQVIVSPLKKLGGASPAMLLVSDKARDYFVIEEIDREGNIWFRATPKNLEMTTFKKIEIFFNKQKISVMEVLDNFDYTTTIVFKDVVNNSKINNAFFLFNTPDDVDVIKN